MWRYTDGNITADNHVTLEDEIPRFRYKTLFDISVNTDQIGMGFEADTPEQWQQHVYLRDFRTKIWLKSYSVARQILLTRSICPKVAYDGPDAVIVLVYLLQTPCKYDHY